MPLVRILLCAPGDHLAAVRPAATGNANDSEYTVDQGAAPTACKAAPVEAEGLKEQEAGMLQQRRGSSWRVLAEGPSSLWLQCTEAGGWGGAAEGREEAGRGTMTRALRRPNAATAVS